METKENRNCIIFTVSPEFHREVKARASIRNMSVKKYIMQTLTKRLDEERKLLPLTTKDMEIT